MDIFHDTELVFSDTYAPKHSRTLLVNTNAPLHSINSNVPPSAGVFSFPSHSPFADRFFLWRAIGQKLFIEERSLCKTVVGGTLCLDFARTSIVPGTSITLLDQNILCIIVPTQSTVHRFHARLVHDISDLLTGDTCNGLLSEISDSEFLNDYHSSYLLTTNGQATKAAFVDLQDNGSVAKIAYCMAEGDLVVVTLPASKGHGSEIVLKEKGYLSRMISGTALKEGVADVAGLISNGELKDVESFYAVHRDFHLRVWNNETGKSRSLPLAQIDSSLKSFPDINADSSLNVRACHINGLNFVIVFIALADQTVRFHFILDHNKKLQKVCSINGEKRGQILDYGLSFQSGEHPKLWVLWNNLSVSNEYQLEHIDVSLDINNSYVGSWDRVLPYSSPKNVNPNMTIVELQETLFNADCYPYDVVHRAIQICCKENINSDKHGNWEYLSDVLKTYVRSPEFDNRYVDRRKSLRVPNKEMHAEAEKRLMFELGSTCDQLEAAARGPVGLFMLDIPGACITGVVQQDRFSVVSHTCRSLKNAFKTNEAEITRVFQMVAETEDTSEESKENYSENDNWSSFDNKFFERWKNLFNEFSSFASAEMCVRSPLAQTVKTVFAGQFTSGLVFATLWKRTRQRLNFIQKLRQIVSTYKAESNGRNQIRLMEKTMHSLSEKYIQLLAQLDMKVASSDTASKFTVLGSWYLEKNDLSTILTEGGVALSTKDEMSDFSNFVESSYLAALSTLLHNSSSLLLFRSLVQHKQFLTLKKLCTLYGTPQTELVDVIKFYTAIAYSGTGQPVKAMNAFLEASVGVSQQNPAMLRTLKSLGTVKEDVTLGDYYTLTISYLSDHGHSEEVVEMSKRAIELLPEGNESTSRIYATLFNHLMNKANWVDALNTIKKNKNTEDRRLTLREFITRLLHAKEYKTLVELKYAELEDNVEDILLGAARSQDVHASPHLFEIVFSYYTFKSNHVKAAHAMYEYAVYLSQVTQTLELLKKRRDAIAIASASMDILSSDDRFLWFPEEVHEIDYDALGNMNASDLPEEDIPLIKKRKMRIITPSESTDEFIIANARVILMLNNGEVPPIAPEDIVRYLIEAKEFDLAFEICAKCNVAPYDLFYTVAKESISLDILQPAISPDWLQKNRRFTEGKTVGDNWSVAMGLLSAAKKVWPTDSRPYRAYTTAVLSLKLNVPCWLHASYADFDIADYVRCLLDYDVLPTAFAALCDYIERETDKLKSVDAKTWLPYTAIDEVLKVSVKPENKELIQRLNDRLKIYKSRISSFETAARFAF
ncbi:unnamed protein product [Auanema sp. JU1783]|nr:unnamed protein product [Auanema sp. JU1783]